LNKALAGDLEPMFDDLGRQAAKAFGKAGFEKAPMSSFGRTEKRLCLAQEIVPAGRRRLPVITDRYTFRSVGDGIGSAETTETFPTGLGLGVASSTPAGIRTQIPAKAAT
jgi:hypothetical protein